MVAETVMAEHHAITKAKRAQVPMVKPLMLPRPTNSAHNARQHAVNGNLTFATLLSHATHGTHALEANMTAAASTKEKGHPKNGDGGTKEHGGPVIDKKKRNLGTGDHKEHDRLKKIIDKEKKLIDKLRKELKHDKGHKQKTGGGSDGGLQGLLDGLLGGAANAGVPGAGDTGVGAGVPDTTSTTSGPSNMLIIGVIVVVGIIGFIMYRHAHKKGAEHTPPAHHEEHGE